MSQYYLELVFSPGNSYLKDKSIGNKGWDCLKGGPWTVCRFRIGGGGGGGGGGWAGLARKREWCF